MTSFDLPKNYTKNPEALPRKNWSRTASSSATSPANEPVDPTTSATTTMAVANVPVGPAVDMANKCFELKTGLITMVRANPFCGLTSETQTHTCNPSWSYATPSS
jgi:hypothetical protein